MQCQAVSLEANSITLTVMEFELLSPRHTERLLSFETANRAWFESLIAPRASDFYSVSGVRDHIDQQVEFMAESDCRSFVLVRQSRIIARANLKNVSPKTRSAEVGYRVGQEFTGSGIGTLCVSHLIRDANRLPSIATLFGCVLDNNPASKRILEKHGFRGESYQPNFFEIGGIVYGLHTLRLTLDGMNPSRSC